MMNKTLFRTEQPDISVIVPVYKTAQYLPKCIDSILLQTAEDFELLLIDDGSPDESGCICDEYAARDPRVKAVHKENGGVSSARNLGIEMAKGRYIVFIDSDDYVDENYLRDLLAAAEAASGDGKRVLVVSDYQPFNAQGLEERHFPEAFSSDLIPGGITAEQFRMLVFDFRLFPPYCKLYRTDIIHDHQLRFDTVLKSAEDFDFNFRYLTYMDRICYIPSVQYHYLVGYKRYVPSNHGVLGQSEIKSVHIMANGITDLAKRTGLMGELDEEICLWAAKKQYFNRLPMLFAESGEVGIRERARLYRQLCADPVYRRAHKRGAQFTGKSTTRLIAQWFDCFIGWWLFYKLIRLRRSF